MAWDRRIVRCGAYRRLLGFGVMTAFASACSLFVSLDDLQSGDGTEASDGSFDDVAATKDGAADANPADGSNVNDGGSDGSPAHSIAFVQANGVYYQDYDGSMPLLAPVIAGDALIVVVDDPVPGAVTVNDDKADAYQKLFGPFASSTGGTISILACFDVKGGAQNIRVGLSDGGQGYIIYGAEYSGVSAFDKTSTGSGASTTTDGLASGSIATTATPELIFAYAEALGNLHPGSGFNARSIFDGNTIEDRIVSSPGSYQATATIINGEGDIVLACFH